MPQYEGNNATVADEIRLRKAEQLVMGKIQQERARWAKLKHLHLTKLEALRAKLQKVQDQMLRLGIPTAAGMGDYVRLDMSPAAFAASIGSSKPSRHLLPKYKILRKR